MSTPETVAILGGTFDPIHAGHLSIAEQARELLGADEVWLIPTNRPPHREAALASARDRLDMAGAAVDGRRMRVVDLEARRPGPSYTYDTLLELERQHPGVVFWIVLGADAARDIGIWHRRGDLMTRGRFLLVNRTGVPELDEDEARHLGFPTDRTRIGHVSSPDISATEIRRRVAEGSALDELVPSAVAALIDERGLYGAPVRGRPLRDNPPG